MSRRGALDVVVAGGGVVGAATALMLAREGLQVALVEPKAPAPWQREVRDLRVYAFAPDNAALFSELGAWPGVLATRVQPYRRMQVWDAAGGDALAFDADTLGQPQLGWIIENNALADALWRLLPAAGVRLHCPARIETLQQDDTGVRVGLDDGLVLEAKLAIAADGGQSALRTLAGIGTTRHDYQQQGVVAFVASEQPHRDTCWQRFLTTARSRCCRSTTTAMPSCAAGSDRSCGPCPTPTLSACATPNLRSSKRPWPLRSAANSVASACSPRARRSRCSDNWRRPISPGACCCWAMRRTWCTRWPGRA